MSLPARRPRQRRNYAVDWGDKVIGLAEQKDPLGYSQRLDYLRRPDAAFFGRLAAEVTSVPRKR